MALINLINGKYYCECGAVHTHYVCWCEYCKQDNEIDVHGRLICKGTNSEYNTNNTNYVHK